MKKINSIKINFDRDNILPGLNKEDLADLGKEDKPLLLKKNIILRNEKRWCFRKYDDLKHNRN